MTSDNRPLSELLEKAGANDIVRDRIGFVAPRLMELDVDNHCGASHGERSEARTNSRHGYRDRDWDTRAGTLPLRLPKRRSGRSFPPFLEPRRIAEKALAAIAQEAYVQGLSTRSVDDLVQAMGLSGISKSQVCACAPRSTNGSRPSSTAPSRATGPTCGSTPPTSRCARPDASSRWPRYSPSAPIPTAAARYWASLSAPPKPSRSGASSCAA